MVSASLSCFLWVLKSYSSEDFNHQWRGTFISLRREGKTPEVPEAVETKPAAGTLGVCPNMYCLMSIEWVGPAD